MTGYWVLVISNREYDGIRGMVRKTKRGYQARSCGKYYDIEPSPKTRYFKYMADAKAWLSEEYDLKHKGKWVFLR